MTATFAGETVLIDSFESIIPVQSLSCLTLNSSMTQTGPGRSQGLQLIIFTGYPGLAQKPLLVAFIIFIIQSV